MKNDLKRIEEEVAYYRKCEDLDSNAQAEAIETIQNLVYEVLDLRKENADLKRQLRYYSAMLKKS